MAMMEDAPLDVGKWSEAYLVVHAFRQRWPRPLNKVGMGLRSMASTATGGTAKVSQRLKRFERIIDKLRRFPRKNLAQMQDIGGCRVVVPTLADLEAVRARIQKWWSGAIEDEYDYVKEPKVSGYRAVHVVVKREDHLVEIQLRTRRQHRWAASVEFVEQRQGGWLRDTDDAHTLTSAFRDLGLGFELLDRGEPVPPDLQAKLKRWLSILDVGE